MARPLTQADAVGGPLYGDYDAFAGKASGERAQYLLNRFPTGKTLIAGCGPGYTVARMRAAGADVWGIDISDWAVQTLAPSRLVGALAPGLARIQLGSVLVRANLTTRRQTAGGTFGVIVTEDLLPALTDAEVVTARAELARTLTAGGAILHLVTCLKPDDQIVSDIRGLPDLPPTPNNVQPVYRLQGLTWKTLAGWKAVAALAADTIYDIETGAAL
jgi:SAM-dependent methyltransferase